MVYQRDLRNRIRATLPYPSGKVGLPGHSDDEPLFRADGDRRVPIIPLSLGQPRSCVVVSKTERGLKQWFKPTMLGKGDLLAMGGQTQGYYRHAIPIDSSVEGV